MREGEVDYLILLVGGLSFEQVNQSSYHTLLLCKVFWIRLDKERERESKYWKHLKRKSVLNMAHKLYISYLTKYMYMQLI